MKIFLKKLLSERNMSVNELHKLTGISRTTLDPLSKAEDLPLKTRFETIQRISSSLNVPVNEVVKFEDFEHLSVDKINVISNFHSEFDPVLLKYYERYLLNITLKDSRYVLAVLTVSASPDDYFEKKYSSELQELNSLISFADQSITSNENELKFINMYEYLQQEGLIYSGKKIYQSNNSIFVYSVETSKAIYPMKYQDLIKNSTSLHIFLGEDNIISDISNFIAHLLNLEKHIIKTENSDFYNKSTLEIAKHIDIKYISNINNVSKEITYRYEL